MYLAGAEAAYDDVALLAGLALVLLRIITRAAARAPRAIPLLTAARAAHQQAARARSSGASLFGRVRARRAAHGTSPCGHRSEADARRKAVHACGGHSLRRGRRAAPARMTLMTLSVLFGVFDNSLCGACEAAWPGRKDTRAPLARGGIEAREGARERTHGVAPRGAAPCRGQSTGAAGVRLPVWC